MKMLMNALIFFFSAHQVQYIFGKVTVLSKLTQNHYRANDKKLICVSEDDGGALVWNDNLIWKNYPQIRQNNTEFHSSNGFNNNEIDCKMNADENCLKPWSKQDWSLTDSLKTHMGPVFDQRWEEFKEYENFEDTYDRVNVIAPAAALSFSIRAEYDAHILLCKGEKYYRDFCYWIIIGGWSNTQSIIRKCTTGVPEQMAWPEANSECAKRVASFKHAPLSAIEWRSFVIKWDSRNISVYDTDNIIMTYMDTEELKNSSDSYYMFIRSRTMMLFRFHIYNFLHTTLESAILTSPIYHFDNETVCIQLLIGLCTVCDAHIMLRDSINYKVLQMTTIKGSSKSAIHGLPMWQYVKIQKNFSTTPYGNVIIQLIPELNTPSSNPLWAIANVRQCPPNGSLRLGVMYSKQDYIRFVSLYWPVVTCQKLFYDEHIIVNSVSSTEHNLELDDAECPQGKIGPQCLFSCKTDLDSNADCKRITICYKDGCTCAPGILGLECNQSCELNKYGYGCKRTCGSCSNTEFSQRLCNKGTGACYGGCDNTEKVYIPPLCQISIDTLNGPVIISTSKTTIQATIVSIIWKDVYKKMEIFYSFVIKDQMKHYIQQPWNRVFQNMTQLTGYFEHLKPGTTYQISCSLSIMEVQTQGDWHTVETDCDVIKDFDVTSAETSVIINCRSNVNQLYPCPADSYYLTVRNTDTEMQIVNKFVKYFPYILFDLPSYTSYNITILRKNHKLLSQQIRTLEGVPSRVLDLQYIWPSNAQLTLTWKAPNQPNGEILRYEILLKVIEYYGCKSLGLFGPDNHNITIVTTDTAITVSDLHPYTSYSAQVTAHNSRYSSMSEKIIFDTKISEIPSEVFSHLTIQGWRLSWHPPEDCTKITGPLKAKIKIRGISDAVKDFNTTKQTLYYSLDLDQIKPPLNGVQYYVARIHVIRNYSNPENISAYQEYKFETPPRAPPKITNLEVIEVDNRQTPMTVHLRWQSPLPPMNGKLRNYTIQSCYIHGKYCPFIEGQINDFCNLWDNYICGSIQIPSTSSQKIQVSAFNVNVTESSPPTLVTEDMLNNIIPDEPGEYTFKINNYSVVDLSWHHPWKTGGHLQYFLIQIAQISSNLKRRVSRSLKDTTHIYPVTKYMRNYSERVYLFPSTQYYAYIQAVTIANTSSNIKYVEIRMPSTITFDGDLEIQMHKSNSTVSLNVPYVLNDTHDSIMHVIIKGLNTCEQYSEVPENLREQIGVKIYDTAWQAAEVSTNELAGKIFMVGDNEFYGKARNCPLKLYELYEITVIVTDRSLPSGSIMLATSIRIGEVPRKYHEMWLIPIILCVVVTSVAIYFYRRRKYKLNKDIMQHKDVIQCSMNDTDNDGYEVVSVISNSKRNLSTLPNSNILAWPTTSTVSLAIENKQQNLSAQLALVESSLSIRTTLPCDKMLPIRIKELKKQLSIQQQILQNTTWQDETLRQVSSPSLLSDRNRAKNRFPELISDKVNRIYLKRYPTSDEDSDYLSAVYVNGVKRQNQYLATQLPMPSTINDFWRMIAEFKVELILMLQPPDLQDPTCCAIVPASDRFKPTPYLNITTMEIVELKYYTSQKLLLVDNSEKPSREQFVTILCLTDWKPGRNQPPPPVVTMVNLWQTAEGITRGDGPTVTLCHDGVTGCGLYLALSFLLERMALERECDICLAVRAVRRSRSDFICSLEHLEYLYNAALVYLKYFEGYANFL